MWNLYQNGKFLEPLKFSNGKTQEDIVNEVLKSIENGKKIIFIHGMCGTGKSAIALNLAKELGKSSIVVPGKSLQNQYKEDYENDKYLLNEKGEKLKISIITGRSNHSCLFLKNNESISKIKREVNSKLNDIFEFSKEDIERKKREDSSANNLNIPCKIDIKEKNFYKIKSYLRENRNVNMKNILKPSDVRRIPLASVCPYWSPALPDKYELKNIDYSEKRSYEGLNGETFIIYKRKPGCGFYEQFNSYIDSEVIVFNALKYKLESAMNRKPKTEVEIIDECDEFLDSFSNQRTINIDRLQNSLVHVGGTTEESNQTIQEIFKLINEIKNNKNIRDAVINKKIIRLKDTPVYVLFKIFLDSSDFLEDVDEENYLFDVEETIKMFEEFFEDSYLTFDFKDNSLSINIVTINLAKRFEEIVNKNKILVLMSGTLHSKKVLEDVFGIRDFEIINAETSQQGTIDVIKTGMEMDCKYENVSNEYGYEHFLKALDRCVEISKKPTLVHVNAFRDLPTEEKINSLGLRNIISREKFIEMQANDKDGLLIRDFKEGKNDVLFTTKCARGVDFPGKECNSIIFTKYPYPHPGEAFWKILKETKKEIYWELYKDKSKRELLQKVYRGLRFKEDHVYLLSPDTRVLKEFES